SVFVLLGGKGEVGKFDTLAEAVQRASDGDTIEVRGNGPFITGPIKITHPSLVIRAAGGTRPVIRFSDEGNKADDPLIRAAGSLVLEGLELQRFDTQNRSRGTVPVHLVHTTGRSLRVANCRFLACQDPDKPRPQGCIWTETAVTEIRNC